MINGKATANAMSWHGKNISYQQLRQEISRLATLLSPVSNGKAAIYSENRPEWGYAFYAAWYHKMIAVPVDFLAPAAEVEYILKDCQPEYLFCSDRTLAEAEQAIAGLQKKPKLYNFDHLQLPAGGDAELQIPEIDRSEIVTILYTSGTTGNAKGVMLSLDSILANIEAVTSFIPIYNDHRPVMALLPFHHIFPLLGTLVAPLFAGTVIAFSPGITAEDIIGTLKKHKISIIIGVPRLYAAIRDGIMAKINASIVTRSIFKLAESLQSRGFSRKIFKKVHDEFGGNIDFLVCGGAKLDPELGKDYKTLGFEMLEGFGMTEAAPMITFTRPGKWKLGAAGTAMPELEVKIKDGEIIARGRNIMSGYFNRPEETAAVIKDGWLHTGDKGYLDDEGFLHVTGRIKEIIVLSNGKNISPEEEENKIYGLDELVEEVAVFQRDDQLHVVVLPDFKKAGMQGIHDLEDYIRNEIIDHYNRLVSPFKRLKNIMIVVDPLPRTRLGKLQRFRLPDLQAASTDQLKASLAEALA
jgi:long-chain acyl-CoA synthetase